MALVKLQCHPAGKYILPQKRRALLRVREKPDIPLWYSVIGGCRPANRETTSNCVRDHPRVCVRTCIEIVFNLFLEENFL